MITHVYSLVHTLTIIPVLRTQTHQSTVQTDARRTHMHVDPFSPPNHTRTQMRTIFGGPCRGSNINFHSSTSNKQKWIPLVASESPLLACPNALCHSSHCIRYMKPPTVVIGLTMNNRRFINVSDATQQRGCELKKKPNIP